MATIPPIPMSLRNSGELELPRWLEEVRRIVNDLSVTAGEANTASNIGTGIGVFSAKSSVDLTFKSILGIGGLVSAEASNDVTIALPDQTSASGKYLTSDGSTATWGTVSAGTTLFTGLTDTQSSITANRIIFGNAGGTALTDDADLTFDGTDLTLGGAISVGTTGTFTGAVSIDDTTDSTSGTTGSLHTDGGLGVTKDLFADQIIVGGSTDAIALQVKSSSSHTAPIATFEDDASAEMLAIEADGAISMGGVEVIRITDAQTGTSGSDKIFIGESNSTVSTGSNNVAVGHFAMKKVTSGSNNCAMGSSALQELLTGSSNFAFGTDALKVCVSGINNVAMGIFALKFATQSTNVGIGANAGAALTTGQGNVFIGATAGRYRTGGNSNTIVGSIAGDVATTGANNCYFGYRTGAANTNTGSVMIGFQVGFTNLNTANTLAIHNSDSTTPLIQGDFSAATAQINGQLEVDQYDSAGAVPVLVLDQGDDSEEMIEFQGTIGTGNALEAVGAKTLTTTHFIKITLPGGLTRYIPAGTIA